MKGYVKFGSGDFNPQKPHMTMKNGPFKDVVLIEKGISNVMFAFRRVATNWAMKKTLAV